MKKIILVVGIVMVIGLICVYAPSAYENRYLWFPMSEEVLRQKVSDFYYIEMEHEGCVTNSYRNFASMSDCQSGVKCISDAFSNVIPKEDLRKLAHLMKDGERAESEAISYFQQHSAIEAEYGQKAEECLKWTIQQ